MRNKILKCLNQYICYQVLIGLLKFIGIQMQFSERNYENSLVFGAKNSI